MKDRLSVTLDGRDVLVRDNLHDKIVLSLDLYDAADRDAAEVLRHALAAALQDWHITTDDEQTEPPEPEDNLGGACMCHDAHLCPDDVPEPMPWGDLD